MNNNDEIMISHNIFDSTATTWDAPLNSDPSKRSCEKDYVQRTPISPIKLSSYAMDQATPQFETETEYMGNDTFVIEQLIDLLQSESDIVKVEAASSLLQLITNETSKKVVELDGIFCLAKALESNEEVVRDECAKCLGKLASVSPSIRDSVIADEGLVSLLFQLNSTMSDSSRRVIIEAITECFNDETRPSPKVCEILIPQFVDLLKTECNEFVINEVCKGILYVCPGNYAYIKAFIENGMKVRLTHLLTHQHEMVVTAALRAIRCLVLPKDHPNQQPSTTTLDHSANSRQAIDSDSRGSNVVDKSLTSGVMQCVTNHYCSPVIKTTLKACKDARRGQNVIAESVSMRHQESTEEWVLSPLTSTTQTQTYMGLSELDLITCQNVEMFTASEEDTNDREAEAGSAIIGQVGLRCKNCGKSPFAKAQFSIVYPGSISLLPASLRHMAEKHFQSCEQTPYETRKRMHDLSFQIDLFPNGSALKKFCADLCMSVGVLNRQPQRSGLILDKSVTLASVSEPKISTPTRSIVPLSLFHPLHGVIDPHKHNIKVQFTPPRQKTDTHQESGAQLYQYGTSESTYFQDHHGLHLQARRIYGGRPLSRFTTYSSAPYQEMNESSCTRLDRVKNNQSVRSQTSPEVSALQHPLIDREGSAPRIIAKADPSTIMHQGSASSQPIWKKMHSEKFDDCFSSEKKDSLGKDSVVRSNPLSVNRDKGLSEDTDFLTQSTLNYGAESSNTDILRPGDENVLTDFTYFTMCQFKSCVFSKDADIKRCRANTLNPRAKFEENFPGLQCIHCVNGNNPRKFFFSKAERLVNSVHELSTHVVKCKHCPSHVKAKLNELKAHRANQQYKLPRGSHKQLFKKVWERLHGKKFLPVDETFQARCIAEPDDKEWLDESECLVRKGIQIFCAKKFDVSFWKASLRKLDVSTGQVGLRCLYCTREELDTVDLDATIFPSKIENIRDDVKTLHQKHHLKCKYVPKHINSMLKAAKNSAPASSVASDKKYIEWAKTFGLFNDKNGVVLYKQNAQQLPQEQRGDTFPPLEPVVDLQFTVNQSSSFDDILPNPPLEMLDVDENTTTGRTNIDAASLSAQRPLPPISSVISVTPCVPGAKRRLENMNQDEQVVVQPDPKKHCAV